MYVGDSSNKLSKDLSHLLHWYCPMAKQVVVQLVPYIYLAMIK